MNQKFWNTKVVSERVPKFFVLFLFLESFCLYFQNLKSRSLITNFFQTNFSKNWTILLSVQLTGVRKAWIKLFGNVWWNFTDTIFFAIKFSTTPYIIRFIKSKNYRCKNSFSAKILDFTFKPEILKRKSGLWART